MRLEEGASNSVFVHVTLAPVLETVGEQKTKPTQHSVQELRRIGIQPDVIVVRFKNKSTKESREKISLFTSVELKSVISNPNAKSIYQVPEILRSEGIVETICEKLRLTPNTFNYEAWQKVADQFVTTKDAIKIAMVGKYVSLTDSYASVNEALSHAGAQQGLSVIVENVDSQEFEISPDSISKLAEYHGILIPQGFGKRGSEGKILAAELRERKRDPVSRFVFWISNGDSLFR